jgi:hypothetical protein
MHTLRNGLARLTMDFMDRGATPGTSALAMRDKWGVPLLVISTASALWTGLQGLLVETLGLTSTAILPALSVATLYWSYLILDARSSSSLSPLSGPAFETYRYSPIWRNVAKVSMLFAIVLLPYLTIQAIRETLPIQGMIYGYLISARTGLPVSHVPISLLNQAGVDITASQEFTDSRGFYILHAKESISRRGNIRALPPTCELPQLLSLRREFEIDAKAVAQYEPRSSAPVFRHILDCTK